MNIYLICLVVLVLMIMRVPVFVSMGAGSLLYFLTHEMQLATLANRATLSIDSYPLIAIPIFMLAGRLMNMCGVTKRIFRFCQSVVGFIPGGLGHVNVAASFVFSGMSGSALADLGGMGQMEIKAIRDAGYPRRFAVGITAASSILGPIVPPSVAAIIYAINAEVSVAGLFLAGFLPGAVIALFLMLFTLFVAVRDKFPREPFPTLRELVGNTVSALPAILAPFLLIGGMTYGFFSPTEAAAVAVVYSIMLGFLYREMKLRDLVAGCISVGGEIASILIIIAMGMMFGWILTIEQVPQDVATIIGRYKDSPNLMILMVILIILFLGCFLEVAVLLLLLPPIVVPSMVQIGFDPLHLGIVIILTIMIGMYTPPFGIGLFAMQQIAKVSYAEVVLSVLPWLFPLMAAVFLIAYVPRITTVLPRAFGF